LTAEISTVVQTILVSDRAYFIIYKMGCHFIFRTVGPLLALSLLNWRLVQSLRAVHRRRQRIASSSANAGGNAINGPTNRQSTAGSSIGGASTSGGHGGGGGRGRENVTMMVVAVICVFIVCELPDVALRVIGTVANDSAATGSFEVSSRANELTCGLEGQVSTVVTTPGVRSISQRYLSATL
jgi:hypothetical protein